MIRFKHKGSFKNTERFFKKMKNTNFESIIESYGKQGVQILSSATPKRSGKTASMWTYELEPNKKGFALVFYNGNVNKHVNIAIIIDEGHGTRNGGYVIGKNYIDPSIQPLFDEMADKLWKEVESA